MNHTARKTAVFVIVLLLSVLLVGCGKKHVLTEDESYAAKDVRKLQSMMVSPDSFVLRDNIFVVKEDEKPKYCFISYSARNSYGVMLQGVAMFEDHEYLGDYYTYEEDISTDPENYNSDEEYQQALEQRIRVGAAAVAYSWQNVFYSASDYTALQAPNVLVKKEIIGKELGIKYK